MKYKGKEITTIGEIFDVALQLAKENKEEAHDFFKEYIKYIYDENDEVHSLEEAERIAKSNFGYWAGYYSKETCNIIYETYQCSHPIFGSNPFGVSPEEAFKKGYELATKSNS